MKAIEQLKRAVTALNHKPMFAVPPLGARFNSYMLASEINKTIVDEAAREAKREAAICTMIKSFNHVRQYLPADELLTGQDLTAVVSFEAARIILSKE